MPPGRTGRAALASIAACGVYALALPLSALPSAAAPPARFEAELGALLQQSRDRADPDACAPGGNPPSSLGLGGGSWPNTHLVQWCHGAPGQAGLNLSSSPYAALVNVASTQTRELRVIPGNANDSYLIKKMG